MTWVAFEMLHSAKKTRYFATPCRLAHEVIRGGLSRVMFVAGALEYERPLLGPLYRFMSLPRRATRSRQYLRLFRSLSGTSHSSFRSPGTLTVQHSSFRLNCPAESPLRPVQSEPVSAGGFRNVERTEKSTHDPPGGSPSRKGEKSAVQPGQLQWIVLPQAQAEQMFWQTEESGELPRRNQTGRKRCHSCSFLAASFSCLCLLLLFSIRHTTYVL